MDHIQKSRISIQVSLSGYSCKIETGHDTQSSGWLSAERVFTSSELQRRYDEVEISLLTHKCALVPMSFFTPGKEKELLSETVYLKNTDIVSYVEVPQYSAVLLYSNSIGESLSNTISSMVLTTYGEKTEVFPEMYYILESLNDCKEYNKIVATFKDGYLHLAIAQGKTLQLCNVFKAMDFTTALYFVFNSMKSLQLNPEVSTIVWRMPLSAEEEMTLYRYFKAVEQL